MKRRNFITHWGGTALLPLVAPPARAQAPELCVVADDKRIDAAALCQLADRLAAPGASNIHSLLVSHAGKLVFERYFSGPDEIRSRNRGTVAFTADTLHDMKSVSKSVASLVFGIAVDRGLIRSLDEPVFNFFPELSDLRSPEKDRIQLLHVLTMSMGLKWVEATPDTGDDHNDEARMRRAPDPCRYVLGLPVTAPAGREFFYNTGALALLATIFRKATGHAIDDFARVTLFEPLGITGADWTRVKGETDAGGGLRLRPRDMVKLGQLVLAGGNWDGRQIVSKAWIDASTSPQLAATTGFSYGYLWWLGRSTAKGRAFQWIAALGRGGQSIRIVPELDLVVVVTAGYYQDYSPQAFRLQSGILRDVLQAISPPG